MTRYLATLPKPTIGDNETRERRPPRPPKNWFVLGDEGLFARIANVLRAILGVPDYERYVEHCRMHHAGALPMTRDEFARDVMERKFSRPGTRCC